MINHEGPLQLPAIRFDFWDTERDQQDSILLEGKLLDVPPFEMKAERNTPQHKSNTVLLTLLGLVILGWMLGSTGTHGFVGCPNIACARPTTIEQNSCNWPAGKTMHWRLRVNYSPGGNHGI